MNNLRQELTKIKLKYLKLRDEENFNLANGDLAKLCNLRDTFDESLDVFFDDETLRKKYNAWDEDENCIDVNVTNTELETKLDDEDLKSLINFYETLIQHLQDDNEL